MRKVVLSGLILIFSVLIHAECFKVLEQNESELLIKFELPNFKIETVSQNNKIYHKILCNSNAYYIEEGKPLIPYFVETVGLPIDGDIDLQIIDKKQRIKKNINVIPSDKQIPTENSVEYQFYEDVKAYNRNSHSPGNLLLKGNKAFIGDRYFTTFFVNAFQFKAKTKELLITTEITFRVKILGNKTSTRNWQTSNNFIDNTGKTFFLNNEYSQKWRKEKSKAKSYPSRQGEEITQIQLIIDKEGIYKITYEYITDSLAGYFERHPEYEMAFVWDEINPRYLELSNEDGAVPIHFVGEADGSFDPGDYFEFYGDRHYGENDYYDDYSSENVFLLTFKNTLGSRMAVENGGLQVTNEDDFVIPISFQQTIHFEDQNVLEQLGAQFYYNSNFYKEDIYFWKKISAPNLDITSFNLQYPQDSGIRKYSAKVSVWGLSDTDGIVDDHYAIVGINNSLIDDAIWSGQTEFIFENTDQLPNSYLTHGENQLYIRLPGIEGIDELEFSMLDYFDITYWREYKTDENEFKFTRPDYKYNGQHEPFGLYQFEIDNFSDENISVYKIGSSILENLQIESFSQSGGAPYKLTFQDSVLFDNLEYYTVTEDNKKLPVEIRPNIPSNLKDPFNSADYIVITTQEFIENQQEEENGLELFKSTWENQGYMVEIISLQDIFDEFNFGIRSAETIKDFISFAYNNWSGNSPSHVLLLGDGITDERDYNTYFKDFKKSFNLIPFRNVWAADRGAITSDNWFACIVGDDIVADLSISRINVWEFEQIYDIASKSLHYLENPNFDDLWHSNMTFAAGGNPSEGTFFAKQCENIIEKYIPPEFKVNRVYCNTNDLPNSYAGNTTSLIQNINDGTIFLEFLGHGGGRVWADYNLLNQADIATFNNDNYPFVSSMSCYGSAYNYPQSSCIGEELILVPEKGAIGHVGFTGYGYKDADEIFGNFLAEAIFNANVKTIGEIVDFTKARFFGIYGNGGVGTALIQGCVLLGDPMIELIIPTEKRQVISNKYNVIEGDTLVFKSGVGSDITKGKFLIFDEDDVQLPFTEYYPFEIPVINDTLTSFAFIVPENPDSIYSRFVKVFAFGDDKEIIGMTNITVGKSAVVNLEIQPESPLESDSVFVSADFFDENDINSVKCYIENNNYEIVMINTENNKYVLQNPIQPFSAGTKVKFHFIIIDSLQNSTESRTYSYDVLGPDLDLELIELGENENQPVVNIKIKNIGSITAASCYLKLYDISAAQILIDSLIIDSLATLEARWESIAIPLFNGEIRFRAVVNENEESFNEIRYYNNYITSEEFIINMFEAGISDTTAFSLDYNLQCEFPANLLSESTIFYINNLGTKEPINQPDIQKIMLENGSSSHLYRSYSQAYEIGTLNQSLLADTLGHFPNGQKVTLKFFYSSTDSLTQNLENENNFFVYRWEEDFQKWIIEGGTTNQENDFVTFDIDRIGIFSIFQNNDKKPPSIEADVEGQEFTHGGYISKNGIISFLISDANGIDVFNHEISLFLNGNLIDKNDYTTSYLIGHLTKIPIKYQLDNLEKGDHTLILECTDVNGNYEELVIQFIVSTKFDIINIGNYPNPVKSRTIHSDNIGRTRFTYVLTDDADKVYIKIYTVSGRLVKTFKNLETGVGYHEFPRGVLGWDCRDKDGYYLANGVYFYRITAIKGNKKIEQTKKMAILK